MSRLFTSRQWKHLRVPMLVLFSVFGLIFTIWCLLGGKYFQAGLQAVYWLLGITLSLSAATLAAVIGRLKKNRENPVQGERQNQIEQTEVHRRLDGMIQLNQVILSTATENDLVERSLEIISGIAGSSGGSFVPFDEWGQPLQAYVFGLNEDSAHTDWTDYLAGTAVSQRCAACKNVGKEVLQNCPLLESPFANVKKVYCLPLMRNGHSVGMVNLYLPANREIAPDLQSFLVMLLDEMALALEVTRLRNQELSTLHQLQLANGQQEDLESIIKRLIEGLRDTLDYKSTRAIFRPAEPRFSGFELASGSDPWLKSEKASELLHQAANQGCVTAESIELQPLAEGGALLVLPFSLPEGTVIGAVLMTGGHYSPLSSRQMALIDTVTTQAALMVENERRRLETEYRTVIQERARLAREIHDSLAQTLAYLKLTSAQMQIQLAHGELDRLAQNLQNSHEALSDAYLETRQAIDNLRFTPQQDMISWLSQIIRNFEMTSGLKAVTTTPSTLAQLSPEVQAQLVRIVQETLSNIRRHAQAAHVWIDVREWNNNLVFDITDDGVGFLSEDIPDLSRHGLRGMRERAELIGAEFQITSQAGQGTTIHIEVPIHTEETPA